MSTLLRAVPYSQAATSSLFDLIEVATTHLDLAVFVFEQFIMELAVQKW